MSPFGSRAWINVDRAKRRLGALDIVAQCRELLHHFPQAVFDDVADRHDADQPIPVNHRNVSEFEFAVIRSMMETAVSASPQVATSRVMICASLLVGASEPNSANVRTISRSDKMPMTRPSAPSTTRALSGALPMLRSRLPKLHLVHRDDTLPFLDRIVLTVIGRLPPPATIPTAPNPGILPTKVSWFKFRSGRAPKALSHN